MNKIQYKVLTCLVVVPLAIGSMAGCGSSKNSMETVSVDMSGSSAEHFAGSASSEIYMEDNSFTYDEGFETTLDYADPNYASDISASDKNASGIMQKQQVKKDRRKLIKTVNMDVETQDFDNLMNSIEDRVDELEGYIQSLESRNNSARGGKTSRYATLEVRIPAASLDQFVESVAKQTNVTQKKLNVEDVTLSYVDMESKKKSLQIEQERLLNLLEKADRLEDIITLENRLTGVRYQIESMEAQLRTYDDLVDYSTIYLTISEVIVYTPVEERTPWEEIKEGFMESLGDIRDGLIDFCVWFMIKLPFLVIWTVIIGVGVAIVKSIHKRRKKSHTREKDQSLINTEEKKPEI